MQSFVSHYESLGVSKFYFINTFKDQLGEVSDAINAAVSIAADIPDIPSDDYLLADAMYLVLTKVSEDFLINVDMDEFWIAPDGDDVRNFIYQNPADYYVTPWVMVINERFEAVEPPYNAFAGHQFKYTVRREVVRSIKTHFAEFFGDPSGIAQRPAGYCMHFGAVLYGIR